LKIATGWQPNAWYSPGFWPWKQKAKVDAMLMSKGTKDVWAVVPVKRLIHGKQRLSVVLLPHERVKLARAMLHDVLTALRAAAGVEGIIVVSADPQVAEIARIYGAQTMGGAVERGLNAAVGTGLEAMKQRSFGALIVPADVPFAKPAEVDRVIAGLNHNPVALTPASSDGGTNALAMRSPDLMAPCFGENSFERHRARARAQGLGLSIVRAPGLGHDIDHPRDLVFSRHLGKSTQTAALLAELDVTARLSASRVQERLG
jgi:2-phospho-L-lactate guanylyltransferase